MVHSGLTPSIPTPNEVEGVSNARMIAELQAVTLGIHLVGLDRLDEVMTATHPAKLSAAPGEDPASKAEGGR